ncbi:hypothetical protein SCHPADRAFT_1000686 [Schizopora paradoxa]|uniref:Uncharacterized protein n=1 Tax=Schizopora paradoxa TaxID=27342 RepID=A0A0H2RAE1_9AGAM|nr:hypothetical protein SCHPADRAFT_1000686 [Schizopora paradoxa]
MHVPGFSFCGLLLCRRHRSRNVVLKEDMGAIHSTRGTEDGSAEAESHWDTLSSRVRQAHDDLGNPAAPGDLRGDSNHQKEFLEAANTSLTAGKNLDIASVLLFPGSDIVFDVLIGVIERVQTTKENDESKKRLTIWISELCSLFPSSLFVWPEECQLILDDFRSDVVAQLELCSNSNGHGKSYAVKFIFAKIGIEMFSALSDCVSKATHRLQERPGFDEDAQSFVTVWIGESTPGRDVQHEVKMEVPWNGVGNSA